MSMLAVENPKIPEVLDMPAGAYVRLMTVVGSDRASAIQKRMAVIEALLQGQPLYVCAECYVPVKLLVHHYSRRFYFKHVQEDGRCTAVTRGELSQKEINARKYNGAKESWRHIHMKTLVNESLQADPRFSEIHQEERWKGPITGNWRKPDVQAFYNESGGYGGVRIAFEIQLSTTYLDVIAERRAFYQGERGLLFWIFAEFPEDWRRLTLDDVFFNNNQNAFIIDEESTAESKVRGEFHLKCIWAEPGSTKLQRKLISFRELTLDLNKQRAFYFDFYGAKTVVEQNAQSDVAGLRGRFEAAWIAWATENKDINEVWNCFYREFRAVGIPLPFYRNQLHAILLNALYSAKYGRVIGWSYKRFIEVAHRIATGHKGYLKLFRHALGVYNRGEQIIREDKSGRWALRAKIYKQAIREGDPAYEPDTKDYEVLAFLFPELFTDRG